ncbi:MAG: type II toxin-antitoxin system HicA family toxin [Candidatus Levyibacteriota bacterium]|nr:MAG: type II toxin-antitoxin system HicA family toxin [Candidatus Levybacteria bacterium]
MILKQVKPKELLRTLLKAGFIVKRKKGSHVFLELNSQKEKRATSVSMHPGTIPKGTLKAIFKQTGLSENDIKKLLK